MTTDPRVAVVTGASRGIGKAIALELANPKTHNRRVALVARTADALEEVKAEIEALGGHATAHACDVGDRTALAETIDTIAKDLGRLDILVNNAGITRDNLVLRMSDEEWDDVLRVNLTSAFTATRAAARPMMRGKFGRIVHISSTSGVVGNAGQANYAAAKSALLGFSKTIARELGSKNITSNVVAPGFIATDMTANLPPDVTEHVQKLQAVRTIGQPQDIAHAVAFLTSDHAAFITGQTLCVDGGMTMV